MDSPGLLAGCAIVLALDPRTALDGQIIGELMGQAGLPGRRAQHIGDRRGSPRSIWRVIRLSTTSPSPTWVPAGNKSRPPRRGAPKRLTLDPEGRAPVILLPDADIAAATVGLRCSGFFASGQWPMVQNRIFVPRHRQGELVEYLRCVEAASVGDPLDTEMRYRSA